jgi:hypothetical protein
MSSNEMSSIEIRLSELFSESVTYNNEIDYMIFSSVKKLGDLIENSHTLPKHATSDIHKTLLEIIIFKKRIKIIQNKLSKEMFLQYRKRSIESDNGFKNKNLGIDK